ncbi:hypothetical protein [Ruegeria arenilitoris]|nr:hypothetical protein [Ruegeria arenilitoris]
MTVIRRAQPPDFPGTLPQERTWPNRRRAATGEDTHDIWTG